MDSWYIYIYIYIYDKNHETPSKNQLVVSEVTHVLINYSIFLYLFYVEHRTPIILGQLIRIIFSNPSYDYNQYYIFN